MSFVVSSLFWLSSPLCSSGSVPHHPMKRFHPTWEIDEHGTSSLECSVKLGNTVLFVHFIKGKCDLLECNPVLKLRRHTVECLVRAPVATRYKVQTTRTLQARGHLANH